MDRPFKTYEQQLEQLREKGLIIGDPVKSIRFLSKENYYNVINGYKDIFIDVNSNSEKYIKGTHLHEICSLYTFDKELKSIYFKYLLEFENNIKSYIAYRFPEAHREAEAFLIEHNFNISSQTNATEQKKLMKKIKQIKKGDQQYDKNGSIAHYIKSYSAVPLWVLVNKMTIRDIRRFYSVMKDLDRSRVCRDINENFQFDYPHKEALKLEPKDIDDLIETINLFRNTCAHGHRLYNFKLKLRIRNTTILKYFDIVDDCTKNGNLFVLTIALQTILSKEDYKRLHGELMHLFSQYLPIFNSVSFETILEEMGFPKNWEALISQF